ncbi:MAG: ABC transporter permease [Candidatus Promineifilaceae bacterium]
MTDLQVEQDAQNEWTMVIRPKRGWFDLNLAELWASRDLIYLFVYRDFVAYYKQTVLGPLWYLIQPLLTTLTFTIIFGQIANISTDGVPDFIFYMAGTVIWTYFSGSLNGTSSTFTGNSSLFGKVYFPRLATPIGIIISKLINFAIQFIFFLAFLAYFWFSGADVSPNRYVLLTPFLLLLMATLGLGLGIVISSLTTRYRDLRHLVSFGVQLLMYATPVVYPISTVPDQYRLFILANPLTSILETFRYAYLGSGTFDPMSLLYTVIFATVQLIIGILIFNQVETNFMDTV